jgi:predicted nuclease with TOPRIM domain
LADLTKHEVLLNELTNIHTLVSVLLNNHKSLMEEKSSLEKSLSSLAEEKKELLKRIEVLENQLEVNKDNSLNLIFSSLGTTEKEELKTKIQNLVNRLDFHLSS